MGAAAGHDEQRLLDEIERELTATDPALAVALSTLSPVRRPVWQWMALAVTGLALLLLGWLLGVSALVVLGTGCAFGGSVVAVWQTLGGGAHDG
ncbi:DUF3040 domain-containing protein [Saccharothrix sp. HUAS TT1]|uniref:DUF3040 domain-containing protein n=1 Tax=unclassified Saccharothrix TaxID=2593673 RepID=UPI00345BB1B6